MRQGAAQVRHLHVGVTVHQLADLYRDAHAAVIAAPDGFSQEIVAGFFKPRQRAQLFDPPFHVAVAGFPIIRRRAIGLQHGVRGIKPG